MFTYHWLDIMNYWFRYHSFFCSGRLSQSLNSLTLCRFIVFDFLTEVLFLLFGSKFFGLLSRSKFTLYHSSTNNLESKNNIVLLYISITIYTCFSSPNIELGKRGCIKQGIPFGLSYNFLFPRSTSSSQKAPLPHHNR